MARETLRSYANLLVGLPDVIIVGVENWSSGLELGEMSIPMRRRHGPGPGKSGGSHGEQEEEAEQYVAAEQEQRGAHDGQGVQQVAVKGALVERSHRSPLRVCFASGQFSFKLPAAPVLRVQWPGKSRVETKKPLTTPAHGAPVAFNLAFHGVLTSHPTMID